MEFKEFCESAKREAEGVVVGLTGKNLVVIVDEIQGEKADKYRPLDITIDGKTYVLTERARKNLLKLTGFTTRLLLELTKEQLTTDINHQICQYESLGVSLVDVGLDGVGDKAIITIFDSKKQSYVSYLNLLTNLETKLEFVKGDPVNKDFIQLQFKGYERENLKAGLNILLSSTGNFRNIYNFGIVDAKTDSYWIDFLLKRGSEEFIDREMLELLVSSFDKEAEFMVQLTETFINQMKQYSIAGDKHFEGLVEGLPVGTKLKNMLIKLYADPKENEEVLKGAGIERFDTLSNVFQFLVYISTNSPNVNSSVTMSMKVYDWAQKLLKTLVN